MIYSAEAPQIQMNKYDLNAVVYLIMDILMPVNHLVIVFHAVITR